MIDYLLCCDWGTSFCRLQLVNRSGNQCVGEVGSGQGVAATFDLWRRTGQATGVAKVTFFQQQLQKQVDTLARNVSMELTGIPIILSGMASSSIGMVEVPYATLPFAVDGSQANVRYVDAGPDFSHPILLISGVRSEQDVMRGEETQLIGLLALLGQSRDKTEKSVFIFPGTHSKHLYLQHRQLIGFATYMTGELFDLMAHHSILSDSVDLGSLTEVSDDAVDAFRLGVDQATSSNVLNGLFTIRTNQLFDKLSKAENTLFLSGLLIGSELEHLTKRNWPIVLCSGSKLSGFYQLAIAELGLSARTTVVSPDLIDRAASAGQIQLYRHQHLKQTTE